MREDDRKSQQKLRVRSAPKKGRLKCSHRTVEGLSAGSSRPRPGSERRLGR